MQPLILPSIIATSQQELDERIAKVKDNFKTFHLDIMDGKFVANESLNFDFVLPDSMEFEAHLMVEQPEVWVYQHIDQYMDNIGTLFVHLEACTTPFGLIQFVKQAGKKIGLVINPETAMDELVPFLDLLDYVLFMTVVPGQYGAAFVPEVVGKIERLHQLKPEMLIQVDGCMNPDTIGSVAAVGVTRFVVGSYLQKCGSVEKALSVLYAKLAEKTKA
jgi:ribulose-phosphate 3-epimerase